MARILLLFDIDGTMLLSGNAGKRAMLSVGEAMFEGQPLRWDVVDAAGHLDHLIFAEVAAASGIDFDVHHEAFRDLYVAELERELDRGKHLVEVMPGLHDLLDLLAKRRKARGDVVLGILTGNYRGAIGPKLRAAGYDPDLFEITIGAEDGQIRRDLVRAAMGRYEKKFAEPCDPTRVVVIGDTPRDVDCAHANGCHAVAVATGQHSMHDLAAERPALVLQDLADPSRFLAFLDELAGQVG